ncbi:hypothetical protein ACFL1H_03490 [Nanoarchaeota archaeon]
MSIDNITSNPQLTKLAQNMQRTEIKGRITGDNQNFVKDVVVPLIYSSVYTAQARVERAIYNIPKLNQYV